MLYTLAQVLLLAAIAAGIWKGVFVMASALKDAADAAVTAFNRLTTAAEALLTALAGASLPPDAKDAMDELASATAAANTEADKLTAAIPPTP